MANFDEIIDRRGSSCLKYDFAVERGYPAGILPFWVADMDFKTPEPVVAELKRRVEHGIFGYTDPDKEYKETVINWMREHHNWSPSAAALIVTPGVVFALAAAVRVFTKPGDSVIIQQPVYYPFSEVIEQNGRKLVNSSLVLQDGHYTIDFADFEQKIIDNNVKLFHIALINLVKQIIHASQTRASKITGPSVLALVGPSGSGKSDVTANLCQDYRFVSPKTYCTKHSSKHHYLSEQEFARQNFFEQTMYAGVRYGTKKEDIQAVLDDGKYAVIPLDMCGAIAMKRHFPTSIIYIARDKEKLIEDVITEDFSVEEKTLRILSLDAEKRNREICDFEINNRDGRGSERILQLI